MRLALALTIALQGAPAPAPAPYATPERAMRDAMRDTVAAAVPGGRVRDPRLLCTGGAAVGERGTCFGTFLVEDAGRRTLYDLTTASRTRRSEVRVVVATLDARRRNAGTRPPPRLRGPGRAGGREVPAERDRNASLIIDRNDDYGSQTLSARTWMAFPVPFLWRLSYTDTFERREGAAEHLFDLPPGGGCDIDVVLVPHLARDAPRERDGRLRDWDVLADGDDDAVPIVSRREDGATTTWQLRSDRAVRSGPAPPGIGPQETDTLIVEAYVIAEPRRFGRLTGDGFPTLPATKAQARRCDGFGSRVAGTVMLRALAGAHTVPRPRPPRTDPVVDRSLDPEF